MLVARHRAECQPLRLKRLGCRPEKNSVRNFWRKSIAPRSKVDRILKSMRVNCIAWWVATLLEACPRTACLFAAACYGPRCTAEKQKSFSIRQAVTPRPSRSATICPGSHKRTKPFLANLLAGKLRIRAGHRSQRLCRERLIVWRESNIGSQQLFRPDLLAGPQ